MSTQFQSKKFKHKGRMLTAEQICKETGLPLHVAEWRYKRGALKNIFLPVKSFIEYQGKLYTAAMLSEIIGVEQTTLRTRFSRGVRGEQLFAPAEKKFAPTPDQRERAKEDKLTKLKKQCELHLYLLRLYHPEQERPVKSANRNSDLSAARYTAIRFEDAARSAVPQNSYMGV